MSKFPSLQNVLNATRKTILRFPLETIITICGTICAILLVEDEHQQRELLTMMLEAEGYDVVATATAEAAFERMVSMPPKLVITDVKLPGIDGFSLFDQARSNKVSARVPFIFITGYNDDQAIERVRRLGALGYITKPYEVEDLLGMVRRHMPASGTTA